MNQSRYLPSGFVSSLSELETRMVNTAADIAYKRRSAGLPSITRIYPFCLKLLELADGYMRLKKDHERATALAPLLKDVSRACLNLRSALQAVDQCGNEALGHAIHRRNREEEDTIQREIWVPSSHSTLVSWLQTQGLEDLQRAADSMTAPRRRGRQLQAQERWASLEFARLCHSHGWSSLQVANGGSERKMATHPEPSDAVVCLAAVFEAAGTTSARSLTLANTALRSLRKGTEHVVLHTYGTEADAYEEHEHYDISLKASMSESLKLLSALPNFIPKEH
ncbi:hypothetical protein A9K79_00490 [Pseudomonas syringae pv. syringae]|nr:hypothetical protein A9K79_00490 [Pseudomonas syringae pv. syringae]